jgi:hypothetical protein
MGLDSYESADEMARLRAAGRVPLGIGERWAAPRARLPAPRCTRARHARV